MVQQVLAFALGLAQARAKIQANKPSSNEPHANSDDHDVSTLDLVEGGSGDTSSDSDHALPLGVFFVAEQKRSGFKRLHRLGRCSTRPQECHDARIMGEAFPSAPEFDAKCRHCFKEDLSPATSDSSGSSSDA